MGTTAMFPRSLKKIPSQVLHELLLLALHRFLLFCLCDYVNLYAAICRPRVQLHSFILQFIFRELG